MAVAVQTVAGSIPSDALGVTLPHEHVFIDERSLWRRPDPADDEAVAFARALVSIELIGRLRYDPMACLDNLLIADEQAAIEELDRFTAAGGSTVIDPTCRNMGRDPAALRRVSEASGLHIVMGTGWYVEPSHPPEVSRLSVEELADEIERDIVDGADGSDIRSGVIGEIGVSSEMTSAEMRSLEAAAAAQSRTAVPLQVHLPGWHRLGHRILDIVEGAGGHPGATVLCHLTPSLADPGYQRSLADRGAWLGYDMIGMDYFFPEDSQSPCDAEIAAAVVSHIEAGYGGSLLLSGDVFLKMMLVRHGGLGYAHVVTTFADRLRRCGLGATELQALFIRNPATLFETAAMQQATPA